MTNHPAGTLLGQPPDPVRIATGDGRDLLCDGAAYDPREYPLLHAAMSEWGYPYGRHRLPDMRGRIVPQSKRRRLASFIRRAVRRILR